jgi:hypothetical protein
MKKLIGLLLILFIVGCEKMEYDDIDDIIINKTEILVSTSEIVPPTQFDLDNLSTTIDWTHANFYYIVGGVEYILLPGGGANETKSHPIVFKKIGNSWRIHRIYYDISMEGIRQGYKIDETTLIMSDAAECYSESCKNQYGVVRPGNFIWLVKINGEDLSFQKIGDETFHHDVSYGDLDLDGDMDVVSTDGRIYYQTSNGWEVDYDWENTNHGNIFFAIEILDIDGGYPEIIQASYLGSEMKNGFRILKRNNEGDYVKISETTNSLLNPYGGEFGASRITSIDINYDGLIDLIIEREGEGGGIYGRTIEIYTGDGQGTFTPHDLISNNGFIDWTQFNLFDVNEDGYLDIVFTGVGRGSGLRLGSTYESGFRLENLIYINNGLGSFDRINKELISKSTATLGKFVPHINKEKELSFHGGIVENRGEGTKIYLTEVTIKNL